MLQSIVYQIIEFLLAFSCIKELMPQNIITEYFVHLIKIHTFANHLMI